MNIYKNNASGIWFALQHEPTEPFQHNDIQIIMLKGFCDNTIGKMSNPTGKESALNSKTNTVAQPCRKGANTHLHSYYSSIYKATYCCKRALTPSHHSTATSALAPAQSGTQLFPRIACQCHLCGCLTRPA